ncbi:conserved hypothetical protein [Talaromyces stipitatus ATCC 10500]|uniref:Cytochrome c oxidase assembly protein n=1 Tax=Talaromyces stipitatus (strain ATCC 10500 / CBS 375.48 / QM 6759 / NRRL 1006) TaxID=441959 RepID=B8LYN9_TALSN|nr:uncharacterized protein TSTA_068240 [Talaromyces stipitatus ATCC 10500]EED23398.1 conserved hypothetical protein [Talaromyces stipitatus ATCC 10500]
MDQFASPNGQAPLGNGGSPSPRHIIRLGRMTKIGLPIIAVLGIGYGITALRNAQQHIQRESMLEEERLRRNAQLMDAYGDKTSLDDMQRAFEQYRKN